MRIHLIEVSTSDVYEIIVRVFLAHVSELLGDTTHRNMTFPFTATAINVVDDLLLLLAAIQVIKHALTHGI